MLGEEKSFRKNIIFILEVFTLLLLFFILTASLNLYPHYSNYKTALKSINTSNFKEGEINGKYILVDALELEKYYQENNGSLMAYNSLNEALEGKAVKKIIGHAEFNEERQTLIDIARDKYKTSKTTFLIILVLFIISLILLIWNKRSYCKRT